MLYEKGKRGCDVVLRGCEVVSLGWLSCTLYVEDCRHRVRK